jgi:hypothetical protein
MKTTLRLRTFFLVLLVTAFTACSAQTTENQEPEPEEPNEETPENGGTKTTFSFREDGTLLVDGKAVFPMGMYYYPADFDPELTQLDEIAAAGFTFIHTDLTLDSSGEPIALHKKFLEKCEALGIHVISSTHEGGSTVTAYKDYPAMFAWTPADDINNGATEVATLEALKKDINTLDPERFVFLSFYYPEAETGFPAFDLYTPFADILAYQMYPVNHWAQAFEYFTRDEELKQVELETFTFNQITSRLKKPFWLLPQAFPWVREKKELEPPTAKESRNISYTGIINGVKAEMYFVFDWLVNDPEFPPNWHWQLAKNEELWSEIKAHVQETNTLQLVFLDGKRTKLLTFNEWLSAAYWSYEGATYVIVSNLNKNEAQSVNLTIPVLGTLNNMFEDRPAGLDFSTLGKLTGTIEAQDVHIYKIQ